MWTRQGATCRPTALLAQQARVINSLSDWGRYVMALTSPLVVIREFRTGETFLVLLYVQLNRTDSGGSASTSHLTEIDCELMAPTEVCSVPGLQRGATTRNRDTNHGKVLECELLGRIKLNISGLRNGFTCSWNIKIHAFEWMLHGTEKCVSEKSASVASVVFLVLILDAFVSEDNHRHYTWHGKGYTTQWHTYYPLKSERIIYGAGRTLLLLHTSQHLHCTRSVSDELFVSPSVFMAEQAYKPPLSRSSAVRWSVSAFSPDIRIACRRITKKRLLQIVPIKIRLN